MSSVKCCGVFSWVVWLAGVVSPHRSEGPPPTHLQSKDFCLLVIEEFYAELCLLIIMVEFRAWSSCPKSCSRFVQTPGPGWARMNYAEPGASELGAATQSLILQPGAGVWSLGPDSFFINLVQDFPFDWEVIYAKSFWPRQKTVSSKYSKHKC